MPCGRPYVRIAFIIAALAAIPSRARAQDAASPAPAPAAPGRAPRPRAQRPEPRAGAASPRRDARALARRSSPTRRPRRPPSSPAPSPAPAAVANPARDEQELAKQGAQRPNAGDATASSEEIFSDDWWGRARPIEEMHGYIRTREQLIHNNSLGRSLVDVEPAKPVSDAARQQLRGAQRHHARRGGVRQPASVERRALRPVQRQDRVGREPPPAPVARDPHLGQPPHPHADRPPRQPRPRLDARRVLDAARRHDGVDDDGIAGARYPTGYQPAAVNGYAPIGLLTTTQATPTAGVNSWTNSIDVKRVWGEYMTPVGQLRFGRMPGHWGLGMVENSGDGIDSDYETTLDRIMFVSGIKSADLYFGGAWDFVSTGPTSAGPQTVSGGQPYNTCNLCNVNEWAAFVAHRTNPQMQRLALARGDVVFNGGLYAVFRSQYIDVAPGATPQTTDFTQTAGTLEPRQAWTLTPDLWLQVLWQKLRLEAEFATVQGQIGYLSTANTNANNPINFQEYGLATQTEYKAIDDKLDLQFGFGWASGDPWTTTLTPPNGTRPELNGSGPISTFAFHPDYRVDLIFYRHILSRVEGTYYFRPSVDYDFVRHADGERLGGGAAVIWSRASQFVQNAGARERPWRGARRAALLPVEGRIAERRAGKARWLLRHAPVRRLLPARRPRLPARPGPERLRYEFVGRADRPPLPWHRLLSVGTPARAPGSESATAPMFSGEGGRRARCRYHELDASSVSRRAADWGPGRP